MTLREAVGEHLRLCRRQAGMTQEELAEAAELHRTYISLLERGINTPSLECLFLLCQILKVEPGEFITQVTELMKRRKRKKR